MRNSILFAVILALAGAVLCSAQTAPPEKPGTPAAKPAAPAVPDVFRVKFETTKGDFVVEVTKAWAPIGARRFYQLVQQKYYDDQRFFRVLKGFMVQFGLSGNPATTAAWNTKPLRDDKVLKSNTRGMISYAMAGPNTRTTQVFINFGNNSGLDSQGFAPFGQVIQGMEVVDSLYSGYGEGAPDGRGPEQSKIGQLGNAYLQSKFPLLDSIKTARLVPVEAK